MEFKNALSLSLSVISVYQLSHPLEILQRILSCKKCKS